MGLIQDIKIEITGIELNNVLEALKELNPNVLGQYLKVAVSILEVVAEKLLKKQIAKRHEVSPFKLRLEYFEAYFLREYLIKYNTVWKTYYVQTVINKLDQKLA